MSRAKDCAPLIEISIPSGNDEKKFCEKRGARSLGGNSSSYMQPCPVDLEDSVMHQNKSNNTTGMWLAFWASYSVTHEWWHKKRCARQIKLRCPEVAPLESACGFS